MQRSVLRWISFLLAVLVLGPVIGRLAGLPRGLDGSLRAAPIVSQNPAMGMLLAIAAVACAGVCALFIARRLGIAAGMNAAGAIFGWCAWNAGTSDAILRSAPRADTMVLLSIEAAILGAASLVLVRLLTRMSSDAASLRAPQAGKRAGVAISVVLACVMGSVCVLLIAFQPLKGQAVFAAIMAAIAVGACTQLGVTESGRFVPMLVPFGALVLLSTLAPLAALVWHGSGLMEASRAGTLIGLGVPHGFDWLCGSFFGVPVGVAWAESMMERRHPQPA